MGKSSLKTIIHKTKHQVQVKITCIWSLNLKAMDNKTKPLKVYIATNVSNVGNEEYYTTKEEAQNNLRWGEESIIAKLFHITETNQHSRFQDLLIYMSQNDQQYYVDMPHSATILDQQPTNIDVVNENEGSF